MKLREYQEKALKRLNPSIANKDKESMRFACMGLLEESGEVIAELRKPLYKGNFHEKPLDKKAITSELGDVMWYIALICRNNSIDIEKINSKIDINQNPFDREKLIKKSINMGRQSGVIAKRYIKYSKDKIEISVKNKDGNNIVKFIDDIEIGPIGKTLMSNIEDTIEEYADSIDKSEKIKILMNILNKYM